MASIRSTTSRSAQNEFDGWSSAERAGRHVGPPALEDAGARPVVGPDADDQHAVAPDAPAAGRSPSASRVRVNPWFEQTGTG